MRLQIAKNRASQVINVDSINNEVYDFMATHIPFSNITYRAGVNVAKRDSISETDVFYKLFEDSSIADKHQLIIVEGSSGSGKSHFIRWLYTNLLAKNSGESDEILLIRRSENTLKGTIKQLLGIDAVKNLKNRDIYERLVKANTTISDTKFKEEIFAKFIVEINVSEDDFLSSLERKRLVALLNNDMYKSKLMSADGPIERIFSKISNSGVTNIDIVAEFRDDDFVINTEFFDEMQGSADRNATSMAKRLTSDDLDQELLERISKFLNSKVEDVIQSCAGIEPGDFQQIFKEIRQELYAQGRNLILLIEDITSFTGINQALLSALVIEHTGLNASDKMCKLVSVVGTTDQYYQTFRDNYKDRITTQITIEDGSIGKKKADLYLFFAKYLNAISIASDELNEWYTNTGAAEEALPIHNPDVRGWESLLYNGKSLSLYPFTKKAIENLYNCMDVHQTPRYILLEILKPAIDELISDKSIFLRYLKNRTKPDLGYAQDQIRSNINKLSVSDVQDYTERAIAFISFWGNGSFKKVGNKIAGIPQEIFNEFGFDELWSVLIQSIDEGVEDSVAIDTPIDIVSTPTPTSKVNQKYENFSKMLDEWYHKKAIFVEPRYIKEELSDFIYNTINWQQYGITNNRIKFIRESGYNSNLVSFERQDKKADKGLIRLDDGFETYQVLRAIGRWIYLGNKSWEFEGSYNEIYILTNWLESRKKEIIDIVKDYKDGDVPAYVKVAMSTLTYEKILKKEVQCLKVEDITLTDIISKPNKVDASAFKPGKLKDLLEFCQGGVENYTYNLILDYFTISQGSGGGHRFLDYYTLEKVFSSMRKAKFELSDETLQKTNYKSENDILERYNKIVKRIPSIVSDEQNRSQIIIAEIFDKFGYDVSDGIDLNDLRELLDDISDFSVKAEQGGFIANVRQLTVENFKKEANDIIKAINQLNNDERRLLIEDFLKYSIVDIELVDSFNAFLNSVLQDVDKIYPQLQNEMDDLTKKGVWIDEDPRFATYQTINDNFVAEVES